MLNERVPSNAYFQIDVVWEGGFKHNIKCRGYNLKSWLNFQESIFWIKSYTYKQITEKQFYKEEKDASNTIKKESPSGRKQKRKDN